MKLPNHRSTIVAIALFFATARPAIAIIDGQLDGTSHPNVGAVDIRLAGSPVVASGTLISPTVFLTDGHVTRFFDRAGQTRARVTFDPVVSESGTWYWGTVHTNPAYAGAQPANDPDDLGVIVFDAPIPGITPATLPTENLLDHQALKGAQFTKVGYGTAEVLGGPNGSGEPTPVYSTCGTRKFVTGDFVSFTGAYLRIDTLDGSICYGDSGGPAFLASTSTIVSVTFRLANLEQCTNKAFDLRIDTPAHRAFLGQYVTLP